MFFNRKLPFRILALGLMLILGCDADDGMRPPSNGSDVVPIIPPADVQDITPFAPSPYGFTLRFIISNVEKSSRGFFFEGANQGTSGAELTGRAEVIKTSDGWLEIGNVLSFNSASGRFEESIFGGFAGVALNIFEPLSSEPFIGFPTNEAMVWMSDTVSVSDGNTSFDRFFTYGVESVGAVDLVLNGTDVVQSFSDVIRITGIPNQGDDLVVAYLAPDVGIIFSEFRSFNVTTFAALIGFAGSNVDFENENQVTDYFPTSPGNQWLYEFSTDNQFDFRLSVVQSTQQSRIIRVLDTAGAAGDTVAVPIEINNGQGIDDFEMDLNYPQSLLRFVSVEDGNLTEGFGQLGGNEVSNGLIRIIASNTTAISGRSPGILANINFAVRNGAAGTGTLNVVNFKGDLVGATAQSGTFRVEINNPPAFDQVSDKTAVVGLHLEFMMTATDPDDDELKLSGIALPDGASFTDNGDGSGIFSWTPGLEQTGVFAVVFVASDGQLADSQTVNITVLSRAPGIDGIVVNPYPIAVGNRWEYNIRLEVKVTDTGEVFSTEGPLTSEFDNTADVNGQQTFRLHAESILPNIFSPGADTVVDNSWQAHDDSLYLILASQVESGGTRPLAVKAKRILFDLEGNGRVGYISATELIRIMIEGAYQSRELRTTLFGSNAEDLPPDAIIHNPPLIIVRDDLQIGDEWIVDPTVPEEQQVHRRVLAINIESVLDKGSVEVAEVEFNSIILSTPPAIVIKEFYAEGLGLIGKTLEVKGIPIVIEDENGNQTALGDGDFIAAQEIRALSLR